MKVVVRHPYVRHWANLVGSLINGGLNFASNILTNNANDEMNKANIEMAKKINEQQIALQRETNMQNANMPTTQYSQLRALGASRASALGALGAPQSSSAPSLNVPQNTIPAQAANFDMANMLNGFSQRSQSEIKNIEADTENKEADTLRKQQEAIEKRLGNLRSMVGDDAYNKVNTIVNKYLVESNGSALPSYQDFLQNITDEERDIINRSGYHTELAQKLLEKNGQISSTSLANESQIYDNAVSSLDLAYYPQEREQEFLSMLRNVEMEKFDFYAERLQNEILKGNEESIKNIAKNMYRIQEKVSQTKDDNLSNTWYRALVAIFGDDFATQFLRSGTQLAARRVVGRYKVWKQVAVSRP